MALWFITDEKGTHVEQRPSPSEEKIIRAVEEKIAEQIKNTADRAINTAFDAGWNSALALAMNIANSGGYHDLATMIHAHRKL